MVVFIHVEWIDMGDYAGYSGVMELKKIDNVMIRTSAYMECVDGQIESVFAFVANGETFGVVEVGKGWQVWRIADLSQPSEYVGVLGTGAWHGGVRFDWFNILTARRKESRHNQGDGEVKKGLIDMIEAFFEEATDGE